MSLTVDLQLSIFIFMNYDNYFDVIDKYNKWSDFYQCETDLFKTSYYSPKSYDDLNKYEINYLNYIGKTFNVISPQGKIVPYFPYSWQVDYHCDSLILKGKEAQNLFIIKSRGMSFSVSGLVELINTQLTYKNTVIPLITQREKNGLNLIKFARLLLSNANINIDFNKEKTSELEIYTKTGSSSIMAFPAGSPNSVDAIRGLLPRPVRILIDEAAFIRNLDDLLTAAENTMQSPETQIIMGSTPKGNNNLFWKMYKKDLDGYKKYFLPAFDEKFNASIPLNNQEFKPLVWWYDINELEKIRKNDVNKFLQEYMCTAINDKESFIPFELIESAIDKDEIKINENYYYLLGVDVATNGDYATIVKIKTDGNNYEIVDLFYRNKIQLEDFEEQIKIRATDVEEIRIDATGLGIGTYQRLSKVLGPKVKGINFSSTIKMGSDKIGVRIKEFMASHIKQLMLRDKIKMINDKLLIAHFSNVRNDFSSARDNTGHADLFWGCALATLPLGFKIGGFASQEINKIEEEDYLAEKLDNLNFFNKNKISALGYRRF